MRTPDNRPPSQRALNLPAAMRSTIERYRMFAPGDHVVVAVSGGADSVALLHALRDLAPEMNLHLTVAHLDHGLRGDESRREAEFVKTLAGRLSVPCVCELRNVQQDKNASGEGLQEAARRVRYRFFSDVLAHCHAQKLALGHTMDDQAETVLIRLLRGASTRGLAGIPPVREGCIVRPLINVRRADIEFFLHERKIEYVADTSACEPQYLRNTIRHELIPLLARHYNPRVVEALCTTADLARDDEALLQDMAARVADKALKLHDGSIHIPASLIESHPRLAGRIIRRALELLKGSCRGLDSVHVEAVLSLIRCTGSSKQAHITGGLVVRKEYDELVIGPADSPADFHIEIDSLPADVLLPRINARIQVSAITVTDTAALKRDALSGTVHVAAGSITLPLIIRSWRPGDRIKPFGDAVEKKVKAVFAERKIPVRLRKRIPLFESNGRIISVGTLRIAEHCRVTLPCSEVIAITITFSDEG